MNEIPIPLRSYTKLLIKKAPPYYDVIKYITKEMEIHYRNAQRDGKSEIVYTVNPRQLADEIDLIVRKESKLTTRNICRSILAFATLCELKENFYRTTTVGGRKNYHFRVNQNLLSSFARIL